MSVLIINNDILLSPKYCERKRVLNGEHTLSFTFSKKDNEEAFSSVTGDAKVEYEDQVYIITEVSSNLSGLTPIKNAYALHIFFVDAVNQHENDELSGSFTLGDALNLSLGSTGWGWGLPDGFNPSVTLENFGNDNSLALFQKIVTEWDIEYIFDCPNRKIYISPRIGEVVDFIFRFNYNIKTFKLTEDTTDLRTAIKGYGKKTTAKEQYYQPVNSDEWIPVSSSGGKVPKGAKIKFVENETQVTAEYISPVSQKISPRGELYGLRYQAPINDERYTTEESLITALKATLKDQPTFTTEIDVAFVNEEYTPILGDAVLTIHEPLDVNLDTRIVDIVDYPFDKTKRPKVTLSNVTAADMKKIKNVYSKIAELQKQKRELENIINTPQTTDLSGYLTLRGGISNV